MTSRAFAVSGVFVAALLGACGATNDDSDADSNGGSGGSGGASTGGAGSGSGGVSTSGSGGVSTSGSGGVGGQVGTSSSGSGGSPVDCVDIPPPPGEYTCEQQAGWGKCDEPWMQGYCFKSCGDCPGACNNVPPPPGEYTCEQQAAWGKCDEPWMQGYCLESCGDCMSGGTGSGSSSSSTSSTSSSSSSSSGTVGPCGYDPVDSATTPEARKLLCYFYSIYGTKVLAGQQEQSWDNDPDIDNNYIQSVTGKLPAVRGQDFLYRQTDGKGRTTTSRAIDWWQGGGISQISYHMGNPGGDDSYGSSLSGCGNGCIAEALTNGTSKNQVLKQRLDHVATELGKLQAANVAVIWRPWHEANGKWFWWGMEGGAEFGKLFRFTYDYLVNTKGIHNVVWEVAWAQPNPDASWDPGKAYYDLAGPDTYDSQSPFTGQFAASRNIVGNVVPISLQENGLIPDPAQMFNNNQAPWLYWNTWTQFEYEPGNQYGKNTKAYTIQCYSDPHTITRDMLPNLK